MNVQTGETVVQNVAFPSTVALTGEVRGGPGWPVWMVTLENQIHGGGWFRSSEQDPDPSGYRLQVVPGKYKATVMFERRQGMSYWQCGYYVNVTAPEAGGRVDLAMPVEPPERTITGIVLDPDGKPVKDAEVSLSRSHNEGDRYTYTHAPTDAEGRYTLTAPEDRYTVYVRPSV